MTLVQSLHQSFAWASSFTGQGLEEWNVENVIVMSETFREAEMFNTDLSNWNVGKVITMAYMFSGAYSFTGMGLSEWNVSHVQYMNNTFDSAPITVDLSKWDVGNVVDMSYMFANCAAFDSNLSQWDVSQVQDMSYMFANATSFQGIGLEEWILNDHMVMLDHMFCGADAFDATYIRTWNISTANIYC
jgi:surface protein